MHGIRPGQHLAERGEILLGGTWQGRARPAPQERIKRAFDILFSVIAMLLLLPAFIGIALAVKLTSRGPVFFCQQRYGRGRRLFTIWKFRTMRVAPPARETIQACRADPRLTPIGSFLRRTSLDELPQFWNVLKGDMSIVGPRPHAPLTMIGDHSYEEIVREHELRHAVRPGITGLAQVSGHRGPILDAVSARGRFERDVEYVGRQSLALDLWIIWRTFLTEFITGTGY